MKIGMMVNDVATELAGYTTVRLAVTAVNRGHEVWFIGAADFAYDPDDHIYARASGVTGTRYKMSETYLNDLHGNKKSVKKRICGPARMCRCISPLSSKLVPMSASFRTMKPRFSP